MNIHPNRTKHDYKLALRELSASFDNEPEPGTEEGDRFDILATLVEVYEAKVFPIESPDPIEAIRFRMEQAGLTVKDLVPSIGQPNRVYEVLNGKRSLTLEMIRNLHRNLGIPAQSLIGASVDRTINFSGRLPICAQSFPCDLISLKFEQSFEKCTSTRVPQRPMAGQVR